MKRTLALFVVFFNVVLLPTVGVAQENVRCSLTPYIGLNAEWRHTSYKNGFGNDLFKHDLPQGNIYVGLKFKDFIGLEIGYKQTNRESKTAFNSTGAFELGVPNVAAKVTKNTVQIKAPYINLVGFLSVCDDPGFQFFGSIGITSMHVKLKYVLAAIGGEELNSEEMTQFERNFLHHKTILQLATGIQYMFCDHLGIRAQIGWEDTSKFKRLTSNNNLGIARRASLRNSMIYSLGILWSF